ncbi:histidine phosphatase family protein [Ferrimonas lipolytica]|uniref:Histidine phosphatase family protein n=1 Tax=Ferrimonas lipolytica TaxID=2724191 RepID=A0A6H1UB52_9GAMM|nr:histidine phosphatase family protein [Ferrimonas lipolytica]QIZ76307.1 histidine phosphatase family protein [Ferrimonas lipolytica]
MNLYLCRHGETTWNRKGIIQGHLESSLSAQGINQAQALSRQLKDTPIDAIYSSDLSRCIETAKLISTNAELRVDPRLRERHMGALQGKSISEEPSLMAGYHGRFNQNAMDIEGSESTLSLLNRIRRFFEVININNNSSIIIVTHGEWIRTCLNYYHGLPPWSKETLVPANCELIEIDYEKISRLP